MRQIYTTYAIAFILSLPLILMEIPDASSQEIDPWVEIKSPISGDLLNDNSIYIDWIGDSVSYYAIELDGSGFDEVGSTTEVIYHTIRDGEHHFRVKAYGSGGGSYIDSVRFTVDRVRPDVITYGPTGYDVTIRTNISFTFSELMDEESVEIEIFDVTGEITWEDETVSLNPSEELEPDIDYLVQVEGRDLAGNDIVPFTWIFRCIDTGTYVGHIVDRGGRSLTNARVHLEDNSTIFSDQDGSFTIDSRWGSQVLKISKDGFKTEYREIFIEPDQVVHGTPIKMDESSQDDGWNMNGVLAILLLAVLLSAFVIFAVIKVGSDEGLLHEE